MTFRNDVLVVVPWLGKVRRSDLARLIVEKSLDDVVSFCVYDGATRSGKWFQVRGFVPVFEEIAARLLGRRNAEGFCFYRRRDPTLLCAIHETYGIWSGVYVPEDVWIHELGRTLRLLLQFVGPSVEDNGVIDGAVRLLVDDSVPIMQAIELIELAFGDDR